MAPDVIPIFLTMADENHSPRALEILERVCALQDGLIQADRPDRGHFETLLGHLLAFTGSAFGFIGEVFSENGQPALRSWALTDLSWNDELRADAEARRENGLVMRNPNTLFGRVLRTGVLLIANDAPRHPDAGGIPAGHPTLEHFMGVPVYVQGRFVGMVGLANRAGGYSDALAREMAPLIGTASSLFYALQVHRGRIAAEAAVARRLAFEQLILEVSTRFIHAGPADFDAMVDAALGRVGRFVEADRSYLFLVRDCDTLMDNTNEWCAEGVTAEKDNLQNFPLEGISFALEPLRQGQPLFVADVSALPEEAAAVRAALEPQGIKSMALVPIQHEGRLQGFVGFDACEALRAWSTDDMALLQVLSEDIGHLLRRTRSARLLAESERRFRLIASHVPQAFFLVTCDYKQMLYVSPSYEELYGQTCASVYADPLSWVASMHEDDRDAVVATMALADREEVVTEYRIRRHEELRWVRVQTLPVRSESGVVEQIAGIAEDVTERRRIAETMARHREALEDAVRMRTEELTATNARLRAEIGARARAEEELRRSSSALRTVAEAIPVVVLILEDDVVRFTNRSAEEMLAQTVGDDLRGTHAALAEAAAYEGGQREVAVVRPDGETCTLYVMARSVDFEGRRCRVVAGIDVTEQRRAERVIREHQATLSRLAHVGNMEGLASAVAHELNQPLASIVNWIGGLSRRAARGPIPHAEILEVLERLRAQALRAGELMRRLRSFSNRSDVRRLKLDVDAICTRAVAELAELASARGLRIRMDLGADGARVLGDEVQIEVVLTNLLRNAMDAMDRCDEPVACTGDEDCRRIVELISRRTEDGVTVSVRDRGCGVPESMRATIFEPMGSTKIGGMGIGLPIARSIVEAHRGRILVSEAPAGGACFDVLLPEASGVQDG